MSFLVELRAALRELMPPDARPLVVHSALWPILRELRRADPAAVAEVLDTLREAADGRSLLMPAFGPGYRDGLCDLDASPCSTGLLCEAYRLCADTEQTLSAFFSYAVGGPARAELCTRLAQDAWGEGSVYEWMEQQDCRFLVLGAHPSHVSYLHRMEWLMRSRIPYRYSKEFTGTLVRAGVPIACTERLYVRSLAPAAENDFTVLLPQLRQAGMLSLNLRGVSLAAYDARAARDAILPVLQADPLRVLANRADFEPSLR